MLTAAVRDLHLGYPGRFKTWVRTSALALWENNPHIARGECPESSETVKCEYPIIDQSDNIGAHFVTAFHHFLEERLELPKKIQVTSCKGDLHLSQEERVPLRESREPYWVLVAGGKFDFTAKWWPTDNFREVVRNLHGRVRFVQVGSLEHYHPRIEGAVDLRGRTTTRQLVKLVFGARGVLCPVTFLMHLAAAVPENPEVRRGLRPCVVVAGGREPPTWEMYPGHQFLHTIGSMDCCAYGGCWKARTFPLNDNSDLDKSICLRPQGEWPECMRKIVPEQVVSAINMYE